MYFMHVFLFVAIIIVTKLCFFVNVLSHYNINNHCIKILFLKGSAIQRQDIRDFSASNKRSHFRKYARSHS